eukprot:552400-Amphidinium_carterae.1
MQAWGGTASRARGGRTTSIAGDCHVEFGAEEELLRKAYSILVMLATVFATGWTQKTVPTTTQAVHRCHVCWCSMEFCSAGTAPPPLVAPTLS